jgi:hypothetical protein
MIIFSIFLIIIFMIIISSHFFHQMSCFSGVSNSLTCEISMGGGGERDSASPWAGVQLNPQHYR